MKKLMLFALTGLLALSLIGCGKKETTNDTLTDDTQQVETTDTPDVTDEAEVTEEADVVEEVEMTEEAVVTEEPTEVVEEIDYENAKLIALTFDDGPNTQTTPKVLDILEENDVVATFFLIGQNINDSTIPVMERQIELGCEIAHHSYSHVNMTGLTADVIQDEMKKTNDKIYEAIGVTPAFFRPPYIGVNTDMYDAIDLPFICGIMANDWVATATAEDRANAIITNTKDGNIILLHDFSGNDQTVEALKTIIPALKEKGFVFVTVSDLFKYKGVDPNKEYHTWSIVE